MISSDLQSIADWIAGCAYRGRSIEPPHAKHLAKVLMALARQAEELEDMPITVIEEIRLLEHEPADGF